MPLCDRQWREFQPSPGIPEAPEAWEPAGWRHFFAPGNAPEGYGRDPNQVDEDDPAGIQARLVMHHIHLAMCIYAVASLHCSLPLVRQIASTGQLHAWLPQHDLSLWGHLQDPRYTGQGYIQPDPSYWEV